MSLHLRLDALQRPITVRHNPFWGLEFHEIAETIVLREGTDQALGYIQAGLPRVIELVGPKGRGKSTHLRYLHSQYEEAPLYLLGKGSETQTLLGENGHLVFIDSIHHLSFPQRLKVYRSFDIVVVTTHTMRRWEYALASKSYYQLRFKGINPSLLSRILLQRIQLAAHGPVEFADINQKGIYRLINRFGDDYRSIINHLYQEVQNHALPEV